MSKKTKKPIKPRKLNREKKPIKLIKILKKLTGSVRFYKPETKKTEPNLNRKKTEPNRKNRAKPFWTSFFLKKPNQTEPKPVGLNRFRFLIFFFL